MRVLIRYRPGENRNHALMLREVLVAAVKDAPVAAGRIEEIAIEKDVQWT